MVASSFPFVRWHAALASFALPPAVPRHRTGCRNEPDSLAFDPHAKNSKFRHGQFRLFSQSTSRRRRQNDISNERETKLREQLSAAGVDADGIIAATLRSIEDPASGYDSTFGKSAIRACRAFLYPANKGNDDDAEEEEDPIKIKAAAGRTSRQVDFLMRRHISHQTEWIRHHDVIRERRQVFPLILILDNLRSAFNVGSLYRTADAAGCQAVLTCGITPHPNGSGADKLAKSALGAELVLDTRHFGTTRDAIAYLRETEPDYQIFGMETTDQSQIYSAVEYGDKVALVLGNEVTGVDAEILSELDAIVEIPTFGTKNSLNVAACAPVVLYEIIRQWGK